MFFAGIAQSVEHFTRNEGVVSSSLISGLRAAASNVCGSLFLLDPLFKVHRRIVMAKYISKYGETEQPARSGLIEGCRHIATLDASVHPGCPFNDAVWYTKEGKGTGLIKHENDLLLMFIGSNFEDRDDLGAEVIYRIENDILTLNKSCFVFIPAGKAHGLVEVRSLRRAFVSNICFYQTDVYEETPAEAHDPEGTYLKNVIEGYIPVQNKEMPPEGWWPTIWIDAKKLEGAPYMEALWFGKEKFWGPETHTHNFDEVLAFFSPDPDRPGDLPGEIHYDVNGETLKSVTSFYLFIPAGTPHSPIFVPRITHPVIHFSGGGHEEYELEYTK